DTFLKISNYVLNSKLNKYQFDEIASILYNSLKEDLEDSEYFLWLIKQDYLLKFNIRPKIFWRQTITREERSEIYNKFINKYPNLIINDLYNYAQLEKYKDSYFLVMYKPIKQILFI